MTTRIDAIRARLEAVRPFGLSFDAEIIEADEYEPSVAQLWAHAPEDIAYLLSRVEELEASDLTVRNAQLRERIFDTSERNIQYKARIAALEEGLRKYGAHSALRWDADGNPVGACPKYETDDRLRGDERCTCGLDSLLSGSGEGG